MKTKRSLTGEMQEKNPEMEEFFKNFQKVGVIFKECLENGELLSENQQPDEKSEIEQIDVSSQLGLALMEKALRQGKTILIPSLGIKIRKKQIENKGKKDETDYHPGHA